MRFFDRARRSYAPIPLEEAQLTALHETTLALLDRLDLEDLLETIVERAGGLVGTRHGYLDLLEPSGGELRVHVGTGIFRDWVDFRLPVGEGLAGQVAATGEPLVVDDYSTWPGAQPDFQKRRHTPSSACR